MRPIWNIIAVAVCLPLAGQQGPKPSSPPPAVFSIMLNGPTEPIRMGTPVNVKVTLMNVSGKDIYLAFERGSNTAYRAFSYSFVKGGRESETTLFHRQLTAKLRHDDAAPPLGSSSIVLSYPPGPIFTATIDLSRLYEIKEPGQYTLVVSRFDEDSKTMVHSNSLNLKMMP